MKIFGLCAAIIFICGGIAMMFLGPINVTFGLIFYTYGIWGLYLDRRNSKCAAGFFLILIGSPIAIVLGLDYFLGGKVGISDVYDAISIVGILGLVSGVMATFVMED